MLKRIVNAPIFKNLSTLVVGTVLAQVVVLCFQIVLRRLFTPEDFGAFAVYMSMVGILATLSALRYEQTILLPKSNKDGIALVQLSIFIIAIYSLVILALVVLFDRWIILWFNFPESYINWLKFLPLSVLLFSVVQVVNYFLIRIKRFSFSASNKVFRRLFEGLGQFSLGFLGKSFGLLFGDLFGQIVIILRILIREKTVFSKFSFNHFGQLLQRYKSFPLKNGMPSLLNSLSLLLPIIIINQKFDSEVTGYFDLARMVLIVPLALVTTSLSQVLLQQFVEKRNANKSIFRDSLFTLLALIGVSIAMIVVIRIFGLSLFNFIFGINWSASGEIARILVWAFAIKFIVSPFNILFTAFEKIGILSVWQILYFLLIISLYIIPSNNLMIFLNYFVCVEVISYLLIAMASMWLVFSYEKKVEMNNLIN